MAGALDTQRLSLVFKSRPDILEGIHQAADTPSRIKLFNSIASFVYDQIGDPSSSEPALKRRRVDIEPSKNGAASNGVSSADVEKESILLEIHDISVASPLRKKLDICFTAQHVYARDIRTAAQRSLAPTPGMMWAWKDIEFAFYLPVPEKSQVQYHYVLFPRDTSLSSLSKDTVPSKAEPLVLTVPASAPKPDAIGGPNAEAASGVSDSYSTLFHWAINKCLQAAGNNVQIVAADPAKFHSMIRQAHRPHEKAVYVKAFRGTKEGYLFFLENGILFGFKKPLLFIPLSRIAAVSYTHVLQRTFNMIVEVFNEEGHEEETTEVEFAMLDQEDYNGINEHYVMRKGLQDRSLADQRKAKTELAENAKGRRKGAAGDDAAGDTAEDHIAEEDDGMTELQRAEKELQDAEDEEEEDYEPDSEDSDGSGSSEEEEDQDDVGEDDEE